MCQRVSEGEEGTTVQPSTSTTGNMDLPVAPVSMFQPSAKTVHNFDLQF